MRADRGFSLAEVLISVSVLGVLGGSATFALSDVNESAQSAACRMDASVVRTALSAFNAIHGAPASSDGDLVPGFLSKPSAYVTVDYSASAPTLTWSATCAAVPDIGAV